MLLIKNASRLNKITLYIKLNCNHKMHLIKAYLCTCFQLLRYLEQGHCDCFLSKFDNTGQSAYSKFAFAHHCSQLLHAGTWTPDKALPFKNIILYLYIIVQKVIADDKRDSRVHFMWSQNTFVVVISYILDLDFAFQTISNPWINVCNVFRSISI